MAPYARITGIRSVGRCYKNNILSAKAPHYLFDFKLLYYIFQYI